MRPVLALALCAACGNGSPSRPTVDAAVVGVAVTPPPPARPELPAGTRSLRLIRTVAARLGPDEAAKRIGTVPADTSAYRYAGSLTTPPCSEGVRWIVMRRTRTDAAGKIAAFQARFGANARPIQPLGERAVE